MISTLIIFIYLLIGACWANIADEFVFMHNKQSSLHHVVRTMLWPLDIVIGGLSR